MKHAPRLVVSLALLLSCSTLSKSHATGGRRPRDWSQEIAKIVEAMPRGGGYATNAQAFRKLRDSMRVDGIQFQVAPSTAMPSFCSGATYLVLLELVEKLQKERYLALSNHELNGILVKAQSDGEGVWGRWNANGPGTARLFHELQAGENFTDEGLAQPGDFMKIFWTDEVGRRERGHSVVYMGTEVKKGVPYVRYFSSNDGIGYAITSTPRSKIRHALFSRLTAPEKLADFELIPQLDPYLSTLLDRDSSWEEALEMSGVTD